MQRMWMYVTVLSTLLLFSLHLGERATENDPTERSSQSPGMQTEVFNKSRRLPSEQEKMCGDHEQVRGGDEPYLTRVLPLFVVIS